MSEGLQGILGLLGIVFVFAVLILAAKGMEDEREEAQKQKDKAAYDAYVQYRDKVLETKPGSEERRALVREERERHSRRNGR